MPEPSASNSDAGNASIETRSYQQEMLEESLRRNIIIAMDTGSGKTHVAVLRLKHESERESRKLSWFLAPTVALCNQQYEIIKAALPVSVGLISGKLAPDQWKDAQLWKSVLSTHAVMVSTPQVLLDALRHGYIVLGVDIQLIVFDEAHHAVENDPYNRIMTEFYHTLPPREPGVIHRQNRPMILGLTASPIFGGNVDKAFQWGMIEKNLDSIIVSPRRHRSELEGFVHRPVFKHVIYNQPDENNPPFSTNLAALTYISSNLDIENDPYIQSLRFDLSKAAIGSPEYLRIDQKLSKTIATEGTFTHKGLRDFQRTATEIMYDLGVWAADWFVWAVLEQAKQAARSDHVMPTWQSREKAYLLDIINNIMCTPVSYLPDDVIDEQSDKVTALIQCLLNEKEDAEKQNETFSGLVFVQRRDVVLALAELLKHHPVTKADFQVAPLLGASDSSHRHAFLDITRKFVKQSQENTLIDFKLGDKNLIISTSVAEEGIDVQACGCVIRWDLPPNMASWAQSRGRARKKRSTFIMMFENGSSIQENVNKWEILEKEMVARYLDPSRNACVGDDGGIDDDDMPPFRVESTGALLTLQSAIPHLNHFCAVMPHRGHFVYQPLYDLDPPDYPIGWHSFNNRPGSNPYTGPWSSTVTLPRVLPQDLRIFRTERIYPTKVSAYRHAAFETYLRLYRKGLLSDNLLPLVDEDEEVEELKKEVEKRTSMVNVSLQMDPWCPDPLTTVENGSEVWFVSKLTVGNLPSLHMLTRRQAPLWTSSDEVKLHHPSLNTLCALLEPVCTVEASDERVAEAQEYTRMLFWSINGSRMNWNDLDFVYLFLRPTEDSSSQWDQRRAWLQSLLLARNASVDSQASIKAPALEFGQDFHYPDDIGVVCNGTASSKPYDFVQWRWDSLDEEEEAKVLEQYSRFTDVQIIYPLIEVRPFHPRTNFLLPRPSVPPSPPASLLLLPQYASIPLLSKSETHYAFLLPSVIRALSLHLTVDSLRSNLFTDRSVLSMIPNTLLITAMCAPVSSEPENYQRLETLGDTVLKLVVCVQLLAQYPLWPEGYLTKRKDHAVSNVRLANENMTRKLYSWIIRDRLIGKKWKPLYVSQQAASLKDASPEPETANVKKIESERSMDSGQSTDIVMGSPDSPEQDKDKDGEKKKEKEKKKKKKKNLQQLSTKVLADVVESLIGAAYVHGDLAFGYECAKFFKLNLEHWLPLPERISQVLQRSDATLVSMPEGASLPRQLENVQNIIQYTFIRPLLLLEALTHPSCQDDHGTISYERMEFLGDAVLDMVVTNFLFHAQGKDGRPKNYSPGHIFLRKSAMVNAHILAFVCLRSTTGIKAIMPKAYAANSRGEEEFSTSKTQRYRGEQKIVPEEEQHDVHLFKCLLHSSPRILEDQDLTYHRFLKREPEITQALDSVEGSMFPWAALTRIQAPKFFSDMIESILGAVYLDSGGNLDSVREVMRSLGLYQILERMVLEDVDVLHPVSRLAMWAGKQLPESKVIKYDYKKEKGRISCGILVDDVQLEGSRVDDVYSGKATQEEVRLAAAEAALSLLRLRDVGVSYEQLKKKKVKQTTEKGNLQVEVTAMQL